MSTLETPENKHPAERLKVDVEPRYLLITSEPYAELTTFGYQVAVNVFEKKRKKSYLFFLGAKSLAHALAPLVEENNQRFKGLAFWVRKESDDPKSKYIVEE